MIGGKSAPDFSLSAGISTEEHEDGIFFTEANEGNEGLNLEDSDVVNQTFVDRPLFAPVENLLSERCGAGLAKFRKGYSKAKSKTKEIELTPTERLSNATGSGFRR